jgi:hypothetical protein
MTQRKMRFYGNGVPAGRMPKLLAILFLIAACAGSAAGQTTTVQTPGQQPAYSFVDMFSNQTITGVKTFTQPIVGSVTGATNLVGPGTVTGNYAHKGTETFAGPLLCRIFENVQCVDPSLARGGTDVGSEINLAYAALPSTGGDIIVAAGFYNFSTPIVFATNNQPARIVGPPAGAATLNYTPTTGTAFTYNVGASHLWGGGLENITLTGAGASNPTTAILLGGTNGAEGVVRRNVKVTGFGTAELYGNNTFLTECQHCVYIGNGLPTINIPSGLTNSGESLSYIDTAIANGSGTTAGCVVVNSPVNNLSFNGGSFDNCQFSMSAGVVNILDTHFENPASGMTVPFVNQMGGSLTLTNPDFEWDNFPAPSPSAAVSCSSGLMKLEGASFFSVATTIAANVNLSGTCEFHESGAKLSSGFTAFLANTTTGSVSTFGNVWSSNQLLGAGNFLLYGSNLQIGPAGGNIYTFVPVNPAASRNISIVDPGTNSTMGLTLNATSGAYQSKRGVPGCTTGATIGAICNFTVTWPASFLGTNYSVTCTPSGGPTNLPSSPYVTTKTTSSITVNYFAITAAAATWAFVDCVGVMD